MSAPGGIEPETELERRIVEDPAWVAGACWQRRMKGHPEARVADHIAEVLGNVDRLGVDAATRLRLRLIALVHDTFKHEVRWWWPGRTDHARLARRFAERHVDDAGVLLVVELHDEGYRTWRRARRTGRWRAAERRVLGLADRLGEHLPLFEAFYRCDNETGSKSPDDRHWVEDVLARRR
jgi:hypothetical protein